MNFLIDDLLQFGIGAALSVSAAGLVCLIVTSFTRGGRGSRRPRTAALVPVGPPRLYAITGGRDDDMPADDMRPRSRESLRLVAGEFGA